MRMLSRRIGLCLALAAIGCQPLRERSARREPLQPVAMNRDSVALELYFVRLPHADDKTNGPLWDELDEQAFEPAVRRQLAANGLRAGVACGRLPQLLEERLELSAAAEPSDGAAPRSLDLLADSAVRRRVLQARTGQRNEVLASGVIQEMSLLLPRDGEVVGQTFHQAQCQFELKATPQGDGRVRLRLTPELHHGDPTQRLAVDQGLVRIEPGRARQVFQDLALEAVLAPGHSVVITALGERGGSLGGCFFTEERDGVRQQKLLLIRVAQTQYDDKFTPLDALPLDSSALDAAAP